MIRDPVPEIVPSHSGDLVVCDRGYVWSLTRNLPGFHPNAGDPDTYPVLTEGLSYFHRLLSGFSHHPPAQLDNGISARARQNIDRLAKQSFVGFTGDPRERNLLEQAAGWLLPRLNRFELLPRQIIHGDWTPRNVLFEHTGQAMRLTAVLDFEAMAWDPICVDVANICSTLLMWSGLDRPEERMRLVVDVYEQSAGVRLEWPDIHTAMLAHWFCHYWYWRDRLQDAEFGQEVKERLCLRIASALSYVGNGSAGPT